MAAAEQKRDCPAFEKLRISAPLALSLRKIGWAGTPMRGDLGKQQRDLLARAEACARKAGQAAAEAERQDYLRLE